LRSIIFSSLECSANHISYGLTTIGPINTHARFDRVREFKNFLVATNDKKYIGTTHKLKVIDANHQLMNGVPLDSNWNVILVHGDYLVCMYTDDRIVYFK
jgi:hypothetical protein